MLKTIRRVLALFCFTLLTLLFLDVSGVLHHWFGWLAKVQFLPAVLALNVAVVVVLCVLTLVFGRIYCSVICPLGVMQDGFAWLGRRQKKNRYTWSPERRWLRYVMLIVMLAALLAGVSAVYALLEPYSAFGRIVNSLFRPLYAWANNGLALLAERMDSYAFSSVAEEPAHAAGGSRHAGDVGRVGLARRTHLLQYDMPCRHRAELPRPLLMVEGAHRQRPLHQVRTVCQELQGLVHRLQELSRGLQPLRRLWRLYRQMQ